MRITQEKVLCVKSTIWTWQKTWNYSRQEVTQYLSVKLIIDVVPSTYPTHQLLTCCWKQTCTWAQKSCHKGWLSLTLHWANCLSPFPLKITLTKNNPRFGKKLMTFLWPLSKFSSKLSYIINPKTQEYKAKNDHLVVFHLLTCFFFLISCQTFCTVIWIITGSIYKTFKKVSG